MNVGNVLPGRSSEPEQPIKGRSFRRTKPGNSPRPVFHKTGSPTPTTESPGILLGMQGPGALTNPARSDSVGSYAMSGIQLQRINILLSSPSDFFAHWILRTTALGIFGGQKTCPGNTQEVNSFT